MTGMRASYVQVILAEAITLAVLYWIQVAFI